MKYTALLVCMVVAAAVQAQKTFTLKGSLQLQKPAQWVQLTYSDGEAFVQDSVPLKNGKFTYKGKLTEPGLVQLQLAYPNAEGEPTEKTERIWLFLEPGKARLRVKDSISAFTVTGSKTHNDFKVLTDAQRPYREAERILFEKYKLAVTENDVVQQKRLMAQRDSLDQQMLQKANKTFLLNHTTSPVALYALTQIWGGVEDASKFEDLYNVLSPEVKALSEGVKFAEKIETDRKVAIGKEAPSFSQPDTSGRLVSLSDFRGKYVLIDFWASWCHPCREENPNLVHVFNQYKNKGFTVLSVSLDDESQKQRWLKAIADDGLTWTHVGDGKGWKNEAALQYGINAIPFNLLIDPQGKIIAKDVHGEDLEKVVRAALGGTLF